MAVGGQRAIEERFQYFVEEVLILIVLVLFITGSAAAFGVLFAVVRTAQPINASSIQNMLDESSFIYDSDGNLIEKVHGTSYRTVVELNQIQKK